MNFDLIVLLALIGIGAWLVSVANNGRQSLLDRIYAERNEGAPLQELHAYENGGFRTGRWDTTRIPQRDIMQELEDEFARNDPGGR